MATKIPKAKSPCEESFALAWKVLGGPEPEREYKFHPSRNWRFDFAWPDREIAVEIEGGVHEGASRGRHMRQEGFARDCEKYAEAALMGWRVLRLTPAMIQPALLQRLILELARSDW
jgi:very-short-patch-repair endonuclease